MIKNDNYCIFLFRGFQTIRGDEYTRCALRQLWKVNIFMHSYIYIYVVFCCCCCGGGGVGEVVVVGSAAAAAAAD